MLIDKRGRMLGQAEQGEKEELGRVYCAWLGVTHTRSLNLREVDNEAEEDAQTEESPYGVYLGIWKFTSSINVT